MSSDRNTAEVCKTDDIAFSPGPSPGRATQSKVILFLKITASTGHLRPEETDNIREILNFHKETAASSIIEYGGSIVNTSDKAIVAWFGDGREALKSGIKIQQHLHEHRLPHNLKEHIQVKIGLHSGDYAAVETSINSEGIETATMLADSAGISQIFVSQSMYDFVSDLPALHFEPVNIWHKTDTLNNSTIYNVLWDKETDTRPATSVVLYLRPLWDLSGDNFPPLWENMIREGEALWGTKGGKAHILEDKSISLMFSTHCSPLPIVHDILRFLQDRCGKGQTQSFLPLHIFIFTRPSSEKETLSMEDAQFPSQGIEPGDVFISADAHTFMGEKADISVVPPLGENTVPAWHKCVLDTAPIEGAADEFLYQAALAEGQDQPCYYCGSRRHKATGCPSKYLPEITRSMKKLGYLSIKDLNSLFSRFLVTEIHDPQKFYQDIKEDLNEPLNLASYAFFDLNRVFQLRFLRTIWHTTHNEWGKVNWVRSENNGGLPWLAQDSLRVSNLNMAESILKDARIKHPEDYRVYCTSGFFCVEKGNTSEAEYFFKKALKYAKNNVHKIFAHFLLSRLYRVLNDHVSASLHISTILTLDPYCHEAVYQDIVFKLHQEKGKVALLRLARLITENKEYYIHALIDPDMAGFHVPVTDLLKNVLYKAKEEAESMVITLNNEIEKSKPFLQKYEIDKIVELREKIGQMRETESYFGYLDMLRYSNEILPICLNSIKERKKEIESLYNGLSLRVDKDLAFVTSYIFPKLVYAHYKLLKGIRDRIVNTRESQFFTTIEECKACRLLGEKLSRKLNQIEAKFYTREIIGQILLNAYKFVRNSAILMAIVLTIGIFLFPIAVYCLNLTFSRHDIEPISNVWLYQKLFIVLGVAVSLSISFFVALKNIFKNSTRITVRRK
ncbi:MAG: hypothetical protein C0392_12400 [Syntrophus sp. (in: bacteria)]|nr:hypothetical protein [Syntrophus sp. (in: bacteria)]